MGYKMRPYPLYLEISLKIARIFACLILHKNLREKVRNIPFMLANRLSNPKNAIKADMFISLGEACKPALHLRNYGLRKMSCPLDWIMSYDLDEAYRCFEVEFSDFFASCYEDKGQDTKNGKERWIVSASNAGMISIHGFPKSASLESYLPIFREKMKKRFAKLKSKILDCACVAFVCARNDSVENLANVGKRFITLFDLWHKTSQANTYLQHASDKPERESKIRVMIINARHNQNLSKTHLQKQVYKISERISVVDFVCDDTSINGKRYFLGNTLAWHSIMCQLRLKS